MYYERDVETPFGATRLQLLQGRSVSAVLLHDEAAPHATLYAARALGATRVIECVAVQPLDRLLEPGDLIVPADLVDLTTGRRSTFFVNKGYGFISQHPVFCPELHAALVAGARAAGVRTFSRGTLAVGESLQQSQQAQRWEAHALGLSAAPAAYLAKELELCYAPLGIVAAACGPDALDGALKGALEQLPASRSCPCCSAMHATRQRGLIGDDWRAWL